MEHQNITLSLPKELLLKIKHIAVDRHTSVSGLLAKTLQEIVLHEDSYEKAMQHHTNILKEGLQLNTTSNTGWKREELHER